MFRLLTALAVVLAFSATAAAAQTPGTPEVVVKGALRSKLADDAVPPPIEAFTQDPRVERIALSSDGSQIAWITRKAGQRVLTTYNVADGGNKVIRLSEDRISAITWLDNDHLLLSDTDTGLRGTCPSGLGATFKIGPAVSDIGFQINGTAFQGTTLAPRDIMDAVPKYDGTYELMLNNALTPPPCVGYGVRSNDAATIVDLRNARGVSLGARITGDYNHMPYGLPRPVVVDGKTQLFGAFLELRDKSAGGQAAQRVYLWRVDPDTGVGRLIDDHGGDLDRQGSYVDDWLVDAAGQPVARTVYDYGSKTYSIQVRKAGKWSPVLKREIDPGAHTYAPFLAGLGRDGASLLLIDAVAETDGQRRFAYFELSPDGKLSEALDGDATRDTPIFDPETGALAGFAHDGELTTYTFFDPGLAEYYKHAVDIAPGQAVRVAALAHDPARMIVFEQGGEDPGSWHYFDFGSGKRVDLGSQYPSVPAEWVAPQRSITYKAADGLEVTAQLTLPPQGEAKARALVVLPHDGPLGHDGRGFNWLAQVLASRGYVVLQPNYRGSDGGDAGLTETGYGQWSGKSLSDLSDGARYLAGEGIIDATRVCIAGKGYGGYAALAGAQADKRLYRCAIAINGISDPGGFVNTAAQKAVADETAPLKADPAHARAFRADAASPALTRRFFGAATPAAVSGAAIGVPVLLVHGERDRIVPIDQSRSLRDALKKGGKPNTYVEMSDCDHDLDTESCRLRTAVAVVDFLKANNPAK
jgi:dipeptidyl aminopeptidase/acylaminoacyl peptidase